MQSTTQTPLLSNKMSTSNSVSDQTFTGVANLIKLLPTGTFFLFQFLNPLVTDNGHCSTLNKTLEALLLVLCAFACCFSSFTDSYTGSDGKTHYGIVTATGIWPSPSSDNVDLSKYKLWFGDFVHAFFSVIVFANLALLDSNTVRCLYPEFESAQKILLEALPPTLGLVSVTVFLIFPNNRHGIGYPTSDGQKSVSSQVASAEA
ncbi:hypothetical protein UlMin_009450 [Ulmus minor]